MTEKEVFAQLAQSGTASIAASFDLEHLPDGFHGDPYPYYRALREHAPIKRLPNGSLLLTRYADLEQVYRHPKIFSSDKRKEFWPRFGDTLIYEHHTTSLVFNDPPLHTHVRRILQGALAPKAITHIEGPLITLVDRLLDDADRKGQIDLIDDFAAAIPIEVIGNLLGIPHGDRGPLRAWSLAILGALEPVVGPEKVAGASQAVAEFLEYLKRLIADRRGNLQDPDVDVLSRLILGGESGESLTETELMQNCIFLLNAGHETTTNFIGNSLEILLRFPDARQQLIENPPLISTALEEFLRFESPNQLGNRAVVERTELGGEMLESGTLLTLCIGAANRDPDRFAFPDTLDIARSPNRHFAFATGIHMCLGLGVARLEGRIAISRFLQRFPKYALAGDPIHGGRARFRGYSHLPVSLY